MWKRTAPKNNQFLAYAALTLVTILWALAGPVIKVTLNNIPPMHFLFFRFLVVCIVLLPTTVLTLKRHPFKTEEIPTVIVLGLLSQSSLALTFIGYQYATALDASIITLISPILSVAAGHYYYNEKVNDRTKAGVILASIGTMLIVIEPLITNHAPLVTREMRVLGNILILLATLSFLLYTLWSKFAMGENSKKIKKTFNLLHLKPLDKRRSPQIITFITFYIGLASVLPLAYLESIGMFGTVKWNLNSLGATSILGILYMALFSSIIAYTLFEWSLKKVSVADTAFFNYLSPVFTLPFAYMLLREVPTVGTLIGGSIIAVGVLIAEHQKN